MSFWPFVWLVVGAALLATGGTWLAFGVGRLTLPSAASRIGTALALAVTLAGAVPELAIGARAVTVEPSRSDLAVGTILGSCVANVLLVLGAAALTAPLFDPAGATSNRLLQFALPLLVVVSIAALLASWSGEFSKVAGGIFLLVAGACLIGLVWRGISRAAPRPRRRRKNRSKAADARDDARPGRGRISLLTWAAAALCVVALLPTILGARALVLGATEAAADLGQSELTIGLIVVAILATLPELAIVVAFARFGERDAALAVVVGSSLFNLLVTLGLVALLPEDGLPVAPPAFAFHLPVAIAAALVCVPSFYATQAISRATGAVLLVFYAIYVAYTLSTVESEPSIEDAFYPMVVFTLGLLLVASLVAMAERLVQKARLADE